MPPDPILRAAHRWIERIPASGIPRVRSILTTNASYDDLTPTQYETALRWLESSGLLRDVDISWPSVSQLFQQAVCEATWFDDADYLVTSPEELPDDAVKAAGALEIEYDEAFGLLTEKWGKVNTAHREKVGAEGEAALVEVLRSSLDAVVDHVALLTDGLGYDVRVLGNAVRANLEVKSTTSRRRCSFYLSRNEYQTMKRDANWVLVFLQLSPSFEIVSVSTVSNEWISRVAPQNEGVDSRWETARFDVPASAMISGITQLSSIIHSRASPLIRFTAKDSIT